MQYDTVAGVWVVAAGNLMDGGFQDGTGYEAWLYAADVAADASGDIWFADTGNNVIREMVAGTAQTPTDPPVAAPVDDNPGLVATDAGSGGGGSVDGFGHSAQFNSFGNGSQGSIAVTGSTLYMTDSGNSLLRSVNLLTGQVKTILKQASTYNGCGYSDGLVVNGVETANVCRPIWATSDGNSVYFLDFPAYNNAVRRYDIATGAVSTVVSQPDSSGTFNGLAWGADGNLYADAAVVGGYKVYEINPSLGTQTPVFSSSLVLGNLAAGVSCLWATAGSQVVPLNYVGSGSCTASTLTDPYGQASSVVQAGQYLYVSTYGAIDLYNTTSGVWSVAAGGQMSGGSPVTGHVDGVGSNVEFSGSLFIAMDSSERMWIGDSTYLRVMSTGSYGAPITAANEAGDGNPAWLCACQTGAVTQKTATPVNDQTGEFWHTFSDLSVPGRGPGLNLSRTYSSLSSSLAGTGLFGPGWSWSYGMSVAVNGSTVTVTQENGSQVAFTGSGSTYTPTQSLTLAKLTYSGGVWTFTRRATQIFTFNSSGQLTSVNGLNGHPTTITYPSGSQTVITDSAGRAVTLAISGGRITSATLNSSPALTVAYGYTSGDLTSVTDVNGGITSFAYDPANQMTEMRSPRYYATGALPAAPTSCSATPPADITSNYYDPTTGNVDCQWDPDGRRTSFNYTAIAGATEVTDPKGNVTVDYFTNGLLTAETRGYGTSSAATWTYEYDPVIGGVSEVIDPAESFGGNVDSGGQITQYFYDANGNMTSQIDPLGRAATWTYNAYDEPVTETPPAAYGPSGLQATTTYTYDQSAYETSGGAGNLTTVQVPVYSPSGTLLSTDVNHYYYGDTYAGDVTSMVDPAGNTWAYTYDTYGDMVSQTAPATTDNSDRAGSANNITKWAYNTGTGWRTQTLSPRFVEANPTAVSCTTPALGCTTYTHDNMGRVLVTADGDGHTTTSSYDPDGNLQYSIDGDHNETYYTYDPAEQQTETTQAYGTASAQSTHAGYWPDGTVENQTNASSAETQYAYDPLGHLTSVTDPDNRTTGYQYDAVANLLVRADPGVTGCATTSTTKGCTIYSYDADNEPVAVNYNDTSGATPNVTSESYDSDGRRTSMTENTQGSTTSTVTASWSYNSTGTVSAAADIAGNTVSYTYTADNQTQTVTYPGSHAVTYAYDSENRQNTVQDWLGNTSTFKYDADNDLGTQTTPTTGNSVVDTSVYDNADNLTFIGSAQGSTSVDSFAYTYDGANQIATVASTGVPADSHTYGYTPLQQLASSTGTGSYAYDTANDPIALPATASASANPTVQSFDPANQQTTSSQITLVGTNTATNTGTTNSSTVALPTGTAAGEQIIVAVTVNASVTVTTPTGYTLIGDYKTGTGTSYGQTAVYRRTAQTGDTAVTVNVSASSYARVIDLAVYQGVNATTPIDAATTAAAAPGTSVTAPGFTPGQAGDQLIYIAGAAQTSAAATWAFPAGYATQAHASTTTTNDYIADRPLTTKTAVAAQTATASLSAQLDGILIALKPSQTVYSYDTRGDLTTITPPTGTATTLTYNQARQLTSYNTNTTYAYDADGLRMTKTSSTTTETYTWDQTTPTPLLLDDATTGGKTEDYIYGPNDLPLEQVTVPTSGSDTLLWYHHDALGSTRTLTNNTGAITGTATYTPYGATTATTGTTTPLGYTSAYTDPETGYQYLINRYYNPTTGQFLNVDPLASITQAPYTYADDDPVNNSDPSGLFCWGVCSISNAWNDTGGKAVHAVKTASVDTGEFVYNNSSTFSTIASGLATVAYAGCVVTEGIGCGVGLALSAASTALSGVNTYRACFGGAGGCESAATSFGLGVLATGVGFGLQNVAAGGLGNVFNSYARDIYLARQAGVIGAGLNGLSTIYSLFSDSIFGSSDYAVGCGQ